MGSAVPMLLKRATKMKGSVRMGSLTMRFKVGFGFNRNDEGTSYSG